MIISIIAAVAKNNVIGINNHLPWNLPDDMKFFMNTTIGHHVIMGRKNYLSIPDKFRPLPNRTNIVLSRNKNYLAPKCLMANSLKEAVSLAKKNCENEVFVIGGADIYKESIAITNRLYLTEIMCEVEGDTYFPTVNFNDWNEINRMHHPVDHRHHYSFDFVRYDRIK